jgi:GntR family transcriptional regulator
MLNPQSPLPLYHQLADILLGRIRTGEYPPGSRIPSEHQMAAHFGIGRPTVRQAIELLARKRLLTRRRGSGTYVKAAGQEVDLFSLAGTTSAFEKQGIAPTVRMLAPVQRVTVAPGEENPFAGRQAYFCSRLTEAADQPVLIEAIYLHPTLFAGLDRLDLAGRSLAQIAEERFFMKPVAGRQTFRIEYLSGTMAADLRVKTGTPVLQVKRWLHFQQARSAVFSDLYCRTDHFAFSQEIGGVFDG